MNATEFFYEYAGCSYNPQTETREQGRMRGAEALAAAEAEASVLGYSFQWELDGMDSTEWTDEEPVRPTWQCLCRDANGVIASSLCGIDFLSDEPWGEPYRRVVEAELAQEALASLVAG